MTEAITPDDVELKLKQIDRTNQEAWSEFYEWVLKHIANGTAIEPKACAWAAMGEVF